MRNHLAKRKKNCFHIPQLIVNHGDIIKKKYFNYNVKGNKTLT